MITVEIVPWDVSEALSGALRAGQEMETAAEEARSGGDGVAGALGTADTAAQAFQGFRSGRAELGMRAAGVLAHNAGQVAAAAGAFISMDQDMSTKAEQTITEDAAAEVRVTLETP